MTMPLPGRNERGSQGEFLDDLFAGQRRAAAKRAGQIATNGAWIAELERSQAFFQAELDWVADQRAEETARRLDDAEFVAFSVHVTANRAAALLRAHRVHPMEYPGPDRVKPIDMSAPANRRYGIRAPKFVPIDAYALVPQLSGFEAYGRRGRRREQIGPDPSTYRYTGAVLFDTGGDLYVVPPNVMPGNAQVLTDTQIAAGPPREIVAPPFASAGISVTEQWQSLFAATLQAQGVTAA